MRGCAPVALFVYNRPEHTRKTIAALARNELAAQTDLYVFSDGPKTSADVENVSAVRGVLRQIQGFRQVEIIAHSENLGLAGSIIKGVGETIRAHGRIIVLEDDLVTSPYCLRYMNDALTKYADDERVVSIQAYLYPIAKRFDRPFFLKDTGSWGWATWRRGWELFEPDGMKLLKELKARRLTHKFDMDGTFHFTRILQEQIDGRNDSWAIRWQAAAFLHDRLTLYPPRTLVRNIGFDGSGVHCDRTSFFDVELATEPVLLVDVPVEENHVALRAFRRYFLQLQGPLPVRLLRYVRDRLKAIAGISG